MIATTSAKTSVLLALLAGCATAPPEYFYALTSSPSPSDGTSRAGAADPLAPTVVVSPAAVPELVDRPQLVAFTDAQRVRVLEQQRWAEPLRAAIPRVVAEGLAAQLGATRVSTRDEVLRRPDCRVHLDVRRFDARPGAAVDLDVLWRLTCTGGQTRAGRSTAREPIRGGTIDAMVAAEGRALDAITRDLSQALRQATPIAAREVQP